MLACHFFGLLLRPHLLISLNSSLQEVAPLSYSFIGSYFLDPYYSRYWEALNIAARSLVNSSEEDQDAQNGRRTKAAYPYTLVRAKNVGMTAILLFARDPTKVRQIEEAECGFGAADMGNKGAVGLRVAWADDGREHEEEKSTELTFVAAHLAAMEWNVKKRNANWRTIMSSLTFANPRQVMPGVFPANTSAPTPDRTGGGKDGLPPPPRRTDVTEDSSEADDADTQPLLNGSIGEEDEEEEEDSSTAVLHPDHPKITAEHYASLQDLSIFKPTSHLFVAGDLNYRISTTTPPPLATFPSFEPGAENHYSTFLGRDQLTKERQAGGVFEGMSEAPIEFGPTYKYDIQTGAEGAENEAAVRAGNMINGVQEVAWRFACHRWPGWCDRVLFLDVPAWAKKGKKTGGRDIQVRGYDALPVMETSDHRPVFFRASVPILGRDAMKPPVGQEWGEGEGEVADGYNKADPRVKLPMPIDVHAWERRAKARRWEIMVGWSAFVWSTPEGAMVLATVVLLGVGTWWLGSEVGLF